MSSNSFLRMRCFLGARILIAFSLFHSCTQVSDEVATVANHTPDARAGTDQVIIYPLDSAKLDGSFSYDIDGNLMSYQWSKLSGPNFIVSSGSPQSVTMVIKNLVQGVYQFELKVTDDMGLFNKDTVLVTVTGQTLVACDGSLRPVINAQLIPVGTLSQTRAAMAIAAAGNKIVFAGGIEASSGTWYQTSTVDIYDIPGNTWTTAHLCCPRNMIASTSVGNKIIFAGGETSDGTWPVDSVDIYDVVSNTWSVQHLSAAGNSIAAASVGDKAIFAGGDGGSSFYGGGRSTRIDIYNASTNSWSIAYLTEPKYSISAVSLNNKLYLSGGFTFNGYSKKIEIFDNAGNSWSLDTMVEKKSNHGGIAINNKIIWAGGYGYPGTACTVEVKDIATGNSSIQYLYQPCSWNSYDGQHLVMKDNKIIFFKVGITGTDKFDIYDLATNTWSVGLLPQQIPFWSSFFSVNNVIYVAGGSTNPGVTNQVWKLEF